MRMTPRDINNYKHRPLGPGSHREMLWDSALSVALLLRDI